MESDFDWLAKPPRHKLFKVIPYKRPSSSFGYSQAVKGTWEQYKKENNKPLATRARFKDSVDFIGWYTNKTESILKISKKDAFKQYLAYHEGWGNYKYLIVFPLSLPAQLLFYFFYNIYNFPNLHDKRDIV